MLVSWNWLKQYVLLDMPIGELERRLMMAGLNHESTSDVDGDFCVDLEVTSNRPDCLGHLGVAREVAALWGRDIKLPPAAPRETGPPAESLVQVQVDCPELCPQYIARVVQGVKIGPSPDWLARRLRTVGLRPINNVVDVTNYVLMECGQPLHAFDLHRVDGRKIIVRRALPGEKFKAIADDKTYDLTPEMCVIADASRASALAGVMGGADSEVSPHTVDLLIEAAEFSPVSVRNTSRRLGLRSDSSYRFERGVDPAGVEWASRRCCELILETAGGSLAAGAVSVRQPCAPPAPVVLRLSEFERIVGITVPLDKARRILASLGLQEHSSADHSADDRSVVVVPPTWRRDLTREIDLIEEVARIHGYEQIPEDVVVPLAPSHRTSTDRVLESVRSALTAQGFDEAMTLSAVDESWSSAFSPWTDLPALTTATPVMKRADHLRRSLVPSLLGARQVNERAANAEIELFEIARVYLPRAGKLPEELIALGLTSNGDFFHVKGALETLLAELHVAASLDARPFEHELFSERSAELWLDGNRIGVLGELSEAGMSRFDLRRKATVGELFLAPLVERSVSAPQHTPTPSYPAMTRDLNLVTPESVLWGDLADCIRRSAGPHLESLAYNETFRNEKLLGPDRKSLLCTLTFRGRDSTLTSDQVDTAVQSVLAACRDRLSAELRS